MSDYGKDSDQRPAQVPEKVVARNCRMALRKPRRVVGLEAPKAVTGQLSANEAGCNGSTEGRGDA